MIIKRYAILGLILLAIGGSRSYAQQEQQEKASKPLELPNFIIEGKEQMNIRSGIKQTPELPDAMTKQELDSLNSLQKEQTLLLPPEQLPSSIMKRGYRKGYLTGAYGRYSVLGVEGGYESSIDEYTFFGNLGYDHSSGHVANSGYDVLSGKFVTDYIAPDKFWIFGGSKTRTMLNLANNSYYLYSDVDSAGNSPERKALNMDLSIHSDGNYDGFHFSTGAGFKTLQLYQDKNKGFDNNINGYLTVKNVWNEYEAGGNALLDMHSVHGSGADFMQINAFGTYTSDKFLLRLTGGFQVATTSKAATRTGFLLQADGEYRFNKMITFKANVNSGMENNSYSELFRTNPYLANDADIDFPYNSLLMKGMVYFHPNESIAVSAGIAFGQQDRLPVFADTLGGAFAVIYKKINKIELFGEGSWKLTASDEVYGNLQLNYSSLDENSNILPYSSPIKLTLTYRKKWIEKFGTKIGFVYIGERNADIYNSESKKLKGYPLLKVSADYRIGDEFKVFADFDNLLNSEVFTWYGYKEKGIFFSLGVLYQF